MDQIKTGKFISALRKEKELTQKQLADVLGISDKTISKWERGAVLPDVSLMLTLCEALEINVNELLTGERLTDSDYKKKAEANIMDLVQDNNKENKKIHYSIGLGFLVSGFLNIIVAIIIFSQKTNQIAVQVFLTVGSSLLFIAIIQFVVGYFLKKPYESISLNQKGR